MNIVTKIYFGLLILVCSEIGYSQYDLPNRVHTNRKSFPIAGSHVLFKDTAVVNNYFRLHPNAIQEMRLKKAVGWGFVVGGQKTWKSVNIQTNSFYNVPSTCRAVGTHCYIFVEDSQWGTKVTQSVVDSVQKVFDQSTPVNPSKGIYQIDVETFGFPPDVDGDSKIIILILDIQDGYNGSGGYVAGYFHSVNELPKDQFSSSNEAEIYFLDCNPANLISEEGLIDGMSTTAHEFQHMIHWFYDLDEIPFVNEGCSLIAEVNTGYPLYYQGGFNSEPNHYLLDWRSGFDEVLNDYSRAARYMLYLRDQFSINVFKPIVQNGANGIAGLNNAFQNIGTPLRFNDITRNWLIANMVNDRVIDTTYGYKYTNVAEVTPETTYYNPNVQSNSRIVQGYAADYLCFAAGSNLSITFSLPSGSSLEIKAVKNSSTGKEVSNVSAGTAYQIPEFGSSVSSVVFVVLNATSSSNASYTVQASGRGGFSSFSEYSYASDPAYYIVLPSTNKKFATRFTPNISGKVYSISLAVNGGSSAIKGNGNLNISVTDNQTGSVAGIPSTQIGSTVTIPFSKLSTGIWNQINMLGANASIVQGKDFHIVWEVVGTVGDTLQFLLDDGTTAPTNRSSSYRVGTRGLAWYNRDDAGYASGREPSQENFLISTVVGVPIDDGVDTTLGNPVTYVLFQNYPNPFNLSTTIDYNIPLPSLVQLKVYDVLGREIKTLVNEYNDARKYSIGFDAQGLSSGVYYYTLRSANYSSTKKLVLIK